MRLRQLGVPTLSCVLAVLGCTDKGTGDDEAAGGDESVEVDQALMAEGDAEPGDGEGTNIKAYPQAPANRRPGAPPPARPATPGARPSVSPHRLPPKK